MKLGIKIGLKSDWRRDLEMTRPDFCEIWFDSRIISAYDEIIAYLHEYNIPAGIHFWGALEDGTQANIAYPDDDTLNKSYKLIEATIDVAQKHTAVYVNTHPGGTCLTKVDFTKSHSVFTPYTSHISSTVASATVTQSLRRLRDYAAQKSVLFTVESVPTMAINALNDDIRSQPIDIGELGLDVLAPALEQTDVFFANDFGHTLCNRIDVDRNKLLEYLNNNVRRLFHRTKLLHVSYIIPPYNGSDYHGNITGPEFSSDAAIPNHTEMKQLLKLFVNRPDVYALVEPERDHVGNFRALKNLVQELL